MGQRRAGRRRNVSLVLGSGMLFAVGNSAYAWVYRDFQAMAAWGALIALLPVIALIYWRAARNRRPAPRATFKPSTGPAQTSPPPLPKNAHARPPNQGQARWITSGQVASFGNVRIPGGMFYLGSWLAIGSRNTAQYAINPELPVDSRQADVAGVTMPYWPSYATVGPSARRALLDWLAGGRSDPRYGIGHVFLYFYGLEHRFFVDREATDREAIVAEIERLLSIYGDNHSFRGYANSFLAFAQIGSGEELHLPQLSADRERAEMDVVLRLHLGRQLAQSGSLDADNAFRWIAATPEVAFRTPAVRCFEELVRLWRERFKDRYPNGFAVKTRSKLELTYTAASGAFEVPFVDKHQGYPDIASAQLSLGKLSQLLEECTDALDAFSRAVGRNPLARASISGAALLPPELRSDVASVALENFRWGVAAIMGERGHAKTTARTLMEIAGLEVEPDGKIASTASGLLGQALDRLDLAMEPDRRYGTGTPRVDEVVYLFKAARGGPIDPDRGPVQVMRMQIEVGILAASADGEISIDELERVLRGVQADETLMPIERARLCAFAADTYQNPPKLASLRKRLTDAPLAERQAYGKAAVATLGAGAAVNAKEVAFLERLYRLLGLPKDEVYRHVHIEATLAPPAKPTERIAPPAVKPSPAPTPRPGVQINIGELDQKRRQTEEVRKFLAELLSDSEDHAPAVPLVPANDTSALPGLAPSYAELVLLIGRQDVMSRADFERKANERRLLPSAAIDQINEWAIDSFGEPLFEDDGTLTIPKHLWERIAELQRKAA